MVIKDYLTKTNFTDRNDVGRIKYIVIHYTAGKSDNGKAALANCQFFYTEYRGASAHYFVDCGDTIYRCVNDEDISWHCGTTGKYYHPECRNSNSLGIEVCSYYENGAYYFKPKAIENAIELTKALMKKYGIPEENVIMHYHVTHKICPAPFITNGSPNKNWEDFKLMIKGDSPSPLLRFVDIAGHYAEKHIEKIASYGIITGYEDNTYRPDNAMTRAEFASVVVKALESAGLQLKTDFRLVDMSGHWAEKTVAKLVGCGIVGGYEDGTFKPDETITRGQASIMASNMLSYCGIRMKDGIGFPDAVSHYAEKHINSLHNYGVVNGYEDGLFRPDKEITRGQGAMMIANCLTVIGK